MKRVNWREWERETHGDDDKHSLAGVPRAVCVTHKSLNHKKHTTAAKPCLKTISQGILLVWFSSINSDLRSCSKTRQEKTFFRPWWPLSPLPSLIYFDDVFCLLPSDLLHKKNVRKMRIKTKKWKEEKWIFCHEHFDFEEQVKRRNQQKQLEKNEKGQRKTLTEKRWEMKRGEKKERDGLMQRMSRGRDQWQVSAHRPDSLHYVATRSNGQESLQSRTRSSTRANLEISFFSVLFLWGILFCWRKFKLLKTIFCCM